MIQKKTKTLTNKKILNDALKQKTEFTPQTKRAISF
jgi:hypothetical protein